MASHTKFAPLFQSDAYSPEDKYRLSPFFTNLDKPVYAPRGMAPEVIGALCSRTSRAAGDLRKIFLEEYIRPFLDQVRSPKDSDEDWRLKLEYGEDLKAFIDFLHKYPLEKIFSNPRARSFYSKWLAQYGDDSIAQMAGMHLVYSALSQVAIKHFEDQRIGLAPLEKSTRYVNYSHKVQGQYLYYVDPSLKKYRLEAPYRAAMDGLFDTYAALLAPLQAHFQKQFPKEKPSVVEKKAFDTLRGLLPTSTLSQVAFFGNGQAFEYMVARSLKHPLGEIRWAGDEAYAELWKVAPSFLRRLKDPAGLETAEAYQTYLGQRGHRIEKFVEGEVNDSKRVQLVEYDPDGEAKVIAGILYAAPNNHASWQATLEHVQKLSNSKKEEILDAYLTGRTQRWQRVGRAFENAYVRFDILMNIGAWRDLHRHRMLTQQRQHFTCQHGFDVPVELAETKFAKRFRSAIERVEEVYEKIDQHDHYLSQYCVTLAHRVRFQQWKNLRQCFWEMELRTIPEGHPDYRQIEQEKFKLLEKAYPLIARYMRVNMEQYDFARRGQEEKIQTKLKELERVR